MNTENLRRLYTNAAYVTLNTVLLVLLLNLLLGLAFAAKDLAASKPARHDSRLSAYRMRFADIAAYTAISETTANEFLDEQDAKGTIGLKFDPWMQFREPTFKGKHLSSDEDGFRTTRRPQARDGKPVQIFVFGGSTTYGYGVPDEHTMPSYLQAALEERHPRKAIRVHNYGQAYYYSSQEVTLLLRLLREGKVPDVAVFLDGGNDVSQLSALRDEPAFSHTLRALWDNRDSPRSSKEPSRFEWIPMVRLAHGLSARLGLDRSTDAEEQETTRQATVRAEQPDSAISDYVVSRYLNNVRIARGVCREFGIRCRFVWQPHVSYKYDRRLHRTFPFQGEIPSFYRHVFARMERHDAPDYVFLGHLLEHSKKKVYVDDVHYNEATNALIARRIAEELHID